MNKSIGALSGSFVDIMEIIGKRAGLQLTYVCESGWPEMMNAIESGKADLGALMKSAEPESAAGNKGRFLLIDRNVRTVVSSGCSDDAVSSNYAVSRFKFFPKKPHDISQLQRVLNAMIKA